MTDITSLARRRRAGDVSHNLKTRNHGPTSQNFTSVLNWPEACIYLSRDPRTTTVCEFSRGRAKSFRTPAFANNAVAIHHALSGVGGNSSPPSILRLMHHEAKKCRNACKPVYFATKTAFPLASRTVLPSLSFSTCETPAAI
jgi:hypothetical protein